MKKIMTLIKKEDRYYITLYVDGILLVSGSFNELPRIQYYKEYKKSVGWITADELNIDFDELIIK